MAYPHVLVHPPDGLPANASVYLKRGSIGSADKRGSLSGLFRAKCVQQIV